VCQRAVTKAKEVKLAGVGVGVVRGRWSGGKDAEKGHTVEVKKRKQLALDKGK